MNYCDLDFDIMFEDERIQRGRGNHLSRMERRRLNPEITSLIKAADADLIQRGVEGLLVHRPMGG